MNQPMGFVDASRPGHVCLLKRSLYGLKQSPRMWFKRLRSFLVLIGFWESKSDPSLFIISGKTIFYLLVYVDDIIITRTKEDMVEMIIDKIGKEFSIRRLGQLKFFWGIQVYRLENSIWLHQQQYIDKLLDSASLSNLPAVKTLMESSIDLNIVSTPLLDVKECR